MQTGLDTSAYTYFVFMNSSVRGPFLPAHWPSQVMSALPCLHSLHPLRSSLVWRGFATFMRCNAVLHGDTDNLAGLLLSLKELMVSNVLHDTSMNERDSAEYSYTDPLDNCLYRPVV
jgi:hypothetical protein